MPTPPSSVATTAASSVRLTELTSCGGCAAKWGAALLGDLVDAVGEGTGGAGAGLLVGLAPSDDAAVVRLADGVALVSTIDFFPPLVDDPDDYGAIAAANACSDVFAMGGDVVLALNVAAFPESLPAEAIRAVFRSAAAVVAEAGGVVAGGHTIRSEEPIFGLAVQGVLAPGREFTTGGARPGDVLVLSKPLGTGLALAAGDDDARAAAIAGMRRLNRDAAAALRTVAGTGAETGPSAQPGPGAGADGGRGAGGVHAVTDVTGFGLMGHAWEMAERSGAHVVLAAADLPVLPGVLAAAERGVRTGGDARNRAYVAGHATLACGEAAAAVGFDPQTSGGLLAAVTPGAVDALAAAGFVPVGHVEAGAPAVTLRG